MFFKPRRKIITHRKNSGNNFHKVEDIEEYGSQYDPLIKSFARDIKQVFRGSKLRFTEDSHYNLYVLKKLVPTPNLVAETISLGTHGSKNTVIVYVENIANPEIVKEIKKRIKKIKAKTIYESVYIQRNIEDSSLSPFPQIEAVERPDIAMSALWQGRVAIILEGSPQVLLAPCTFFDLIDTPDDAYTRWFFTASFFRIARFIMLLIAICLPGFYIALLSYNPELVPTRLLLVVINSREGTPFPIYFETFLMMGVAEAVRMMMIRMPSQLGSTVALFSSITLVIAGLFSNIIGSTVVMVATLTVIASFGIPDYDLRSSIRIIQFFTMIISSFLGLFGFAVAFFSILIHLVTLKSFGIPYMAPFAPMEGSGLGHTILRENTKRMPIDETYKPQRS
ncbi:MAG: spore germination protein [Dehalobacterium sp.]